MTNIQKRCRRLYNQLRPLDPIDGWESLPDADAEKFLAMLELERNMALELGLPLGYDPDGNVLRANVTYGPDCRPIPGSGPPPKGGQGARAENPEDELVFDRMRALSPRLSRAEATDEALVHLADQALADLVAQGRLEPIGMVAANGDVAYRLTEDHGKPLPEGVLPFRN